ncbi:MAG: aspartate 1-decarboxylase [Verrucomicrobiae bacterium]|nr:aspartate 1-decarboxylase [Verrucomicrobiae bacterium]
MLVSVLKSKLHRACVTDADLHYEGSLTLSPHLIDLCGILPYERVLVSNMSNGERFETYVIVGKKSGPEVCLNGATAHLGKIGDRLTIMTFGLMEIEKARKHKPVAILLDEHNKPVRSSDQAEARAGE